MYESHVLNPGAPLTCTPQDSYGEAALTLPAADRSSKCKARQLIRLIIIASRVQRQDFRSGCWGVLLYRFGALKWDLAPEPQLVRIQCPISRTLLTAIYLFILSSFVVPLCLLLFFLEFLRHTSVCLRLSATLPVSPLQPLCLLMFGKINDNRTVVRNLGKVLFFCFFIPLGKPTSQVGAEG